MSDISDLEQLDGNISLCSNTNTYQTLTNNNRGKYFSVANHLPVLSVCNVRSFFPKQNNWKNDFFEHQGDVSLLCEVWQKEESKLHMQHIEHMLQIDGLQYFSTTRPRGKRGGGAAIIVNREKFNAQKLDIQIPQKLEIIWALVKPKSEAAQIRNIIVCSFYSPPRSRLMNKLKDHIVGTLQMLTTKYPGCGIFVGGDKNKMNISQLLNNNLKLKQIVSKPTHKNEILDVILTNLYPYLNTTI